MSTGTGPAGAMPPLDAEGCFLAHRGTVYRWARALGLGHEEALDVTQEVFLRLVRTPPRVESAAAQMGWLRRVTANAAVDRHRSAGVRAAARARLAGGSDEDAARAGEEERQRVREAVAGLSEMQRLVLLAKVADGLTFAQIAADLGIAEPTAKTHYVRALTAVRGAMGVDVETGEARRSVRR